jgi:PAS domain S-box-containing protein
MVRTGRMSPITASCFVFAGIALLALVTSINRKRSSVWTGILASLVLAEMLVVFLGYVFGSPLLYVGNAIPVALPTAIAFLLMGTGLVARAGPDRYPLRIFTGSTTHSLLMRTFLPITILTILFTSFLHSLFPATEQMNKAELSALSVLMSSVAVSVVISRTSKNIGGAIDRARDEQRKAVEALRESEQQFSATFHQAAVGIGQLSPDGRWTMVNERLCNITGYNEAELLSRPVDSISDPMDLLAEEECDRLLLMGKIPTYSVQQRLTRKDGQSVWVQLTKAVVRNDAGEPKYLIAVVEDIGLRKRAEDMLHRTNEELEKRVEEPSWNSLPMSPLMICRSRCGWWQATCSLFHGGIRTSWILTGRNSLASR